MRKPTVARTCPGLQWVKQQEPVKDRVNEYVTVYFVFCRLNTDDSVCWKTIAAGDMVAHSSLH